MEAFVYCWTDSDTNMIYVGSHKGADNDGYICSSKYMLEEYNKRPHAFSRQVIAHGNYDDVRALETAILKSANAKNNKAFYNRSNGSREFFTTKPLCEETKKKLSKSVKTACSQRDCKHTEESKKKMSESTKGMYAGEKNPMHGRTHTPEARRKISESRKGRPTTLGAKRPDVAARNKMNAGKRQNKGSN